VAGQAEWSAGAAQQEEAPAGPAGQAEHPVAGVVVEEAEPPARAVRRVLERSAEDLWAGDRVGVQRGHWVARAAAGPAEIRRARSWAPQVPGHRKWAPVARS